ncbi:hypothetical protein F959_01408 [Acinetobacter venetianus RAG-1 = CIP 110063]|uniref:Uncharacterized protein n=1 Tax=Acinetobacter venetianus (strain ATCC 31012 / DSM 23050 / BCRC 14357 / CCUG 45561 / CIP 110063 / KCTC 2702 / LMG 19082 / RAG-1) TaxID=1191460 RepID=N8YM09_ACIVR|nr:hypothetical protein [Acinetobacter venetianus]ENV37887.1 hypothetical protein F959_01408 [Acinetobacter venetianus RAG-1 = CIP 110063]
MKKNHLLFILSTSLTLLVCSSAQSAEQSKLKLGTSAIEFAAQTKCSHDIDDFAAWKVASRLMSSELKKQKKNKYVNVLERMHQLFCLHLNLL